MGFEVIDNEDAPSAQGKGFSPSFATFKQRGTSPLEAWYSGVVNQTAYSTVSATLDSFYARPVVIGRSGFIDRIAFEVTAGGGAGSVGRCGIYNNTSKSTLYPSSLVVDGGEFDCTTNTIKATTVNVFLQAGIYWFVTHTGVASPTCRSFVAGGLNSILGVQNSIGSLPMVVILKAQAYAPLPATCYSGLVVNSSVRAIVHVRFSS